MSPGLMAFSEELCANHDSRYRAQKNRNSRSQIVSLANKDKLRWNNSTTEEGVFYHTLKLLSSLQSLQVGQSKVSYSKLMAMEQSWSYLCLQNESECPKGVQRPTAKNDARDYKQERQKVLIRVSLSGPNTNDICWGLVPFIWTSLAEQKSSILRILTTLVLIPF